jgi:hypothetical protein
MKTNFSPFFGHPFLRKNANIVTINLTTAWSIKVFTHLDPKLHPVHQTKPKSLQKKGSRVELAERHQNSCQKRFGSKNLASAVTKSCGGLRDESEKRSAYPK